MAILRNVGTVSRTACAASVGAACAAALLLATPSVAATAAPAAAQQEPEVQDTGHQSQQLRAAANHSTDPGVTHPSADYMGSQVRKHSSPEAEHPAERSMSAETLAAQAVVQTPGLDVSSWQGNVDWATVKANGAKFAYAKATEGTGYTNPYFGNQYNGPYQQGIVRGAYHFALPDKSSGAEQANYFVDHGGGWSPDGMTLPGALDIEWNPYGGDCYGLSQSAMVGWIKSFSDQYHSRTGRWPVIYTATSWWQECTGNRGDFSGTNPLWVANYSSSPAPMPYDWDYQTIWQFDNSGVFPGDQNRFNGPFSGIRALATG